MLRISSVLSDVTNNEAFAAFVSQNQSVDALGLLISDIHNMKLARTRLNCLRKAQPLVASSPPHFEIKVADVLPCIAIPAPSLLEMQALLAKFELHADYNRSVDKARASIRNERHS